MLTSGSGSGATWRQHPTRVRRPMTAWKSRRCLTASNGSSSCGWRRLLRKPNGLVLRMAEVRLNHPPTCAAGMGNRPQELGCGPGLWAVGHAVGLRRQSVDPTQRRSIQFKGPGRDLQPENGRCALRETARGLGSRRSEPTPAEDGDRNHEAVRRQ